MWDLIVSVPDHCLSFYFSCCENRVAYLIHHIFNRNGIYTGGKPNTILFDEKGLIDISQCKQNSETKK